MIYDLFALRWATNPRRMRHQNFMGYHGDAHDSPMPIDFFVWVAVGGGRTVLIDSGSDRHTCARRGHDFLCCPAEGLACLGVGAADVDTVVTTHLHWDHSGNYDKFPNARFHAQRREIEHAVGPCMCEPFLRRPYEVEQVVAFVRMVYGERATFHDGDEEIAPGISVHRLEGHTPGLQAVRVETGRGPVVLASDTMHYYENFAARTPFPVVTNVDDYLRALSRIAELAESPDHVIPGHDPEVMRLYSAPSLEAQGIAVRLDGDPSRDGVAA